MTLIVQAILRTFYSLNNLVHSFPDSFYCIVVSCYHRAKLNYLLEL